jgi:hypothetical protein
MHRLERCAMVFFSVFLVAFSHDTSPLIKIFLDLIFWNHCINKIPSSSSGEALSFLFYSNIVQTDIPCQILRLSVTLCYLIMEPAQDASKFHLATQLNSVSFSEYRNFKFITYCHLLSVQSRGQL